MLGLTSLSIFCVTAVLTELPTIVKSHSSKLFLALYFMRMISAICAPMAFFLHGLWPLSKIIGLCRLLSGERLNKLGKFGHSH